MKDREEDSMIWDYIITVQPLPIGHNKEGNRILGGFLYLQQFVNRVGPLVNSHWGHQDREERIGEWVFKEAARIIGPLHIVSDGV